MGITGVRNFVKDREPTTVEDVVNHIDHVVKLVGIDHVGIGTDSDLMGYDRLPADQYRELKSGYKASYAFRDKIDTDGFNNPDKMYSLTDALLRRGYSDANVEAILGVRPGPGEHDGDERQGAGKRAGERGCQVICGALPG